MCPVGREKIMQKKGGNPGPKSLGGGRGRHPESKGLTFDGSRENNILTDVGSFVDPKEGNQEAW